MEKTNLLYKIASRIPKGKATTYGELAKLSGIKNPRVVGNILHRNKNPEKTPCHRVVNRKGEVSANFAFGGAKEQIKKLRLEKVEINKDRVDLGKYLWKPIKGSV